MPRIRDLQQYTGALNRGDIYFVVDGSSFGRGQKLSGLQVYTMCKGEDGKNIEIRASGGFLQWKQEGTPGWTNLVALNDLKGADGKDIELRKYEGYIQSRPVGGNWANLVSLNDLKGDKGDPAETPNLSFTAVPVTGGGQPTAQVSGVYPNLQIELGLPAGRDAAAPNLTFRTKPLAPGEQPTANVTGDYPNLQIELGMPAGRDAEAPAFTFAAESLPAGQQPEVAMSGSYPNLQLTFKLPRGERGLQGKPLTVLPNGHYGQWDEGQGKYVDSGVEAAATVDINNVTVTFSEAAVRAQIETGESIPTLFGKIRKWFSDLKALAFKDKVDYNTDVENTPALGALAKKSSVDYNTEVDNTPALGALAKKSRVDYNADIDSLPSLVTLHDVQSEVNTHNQAGNAHTDIRGLITALTSSALTAARVKQGAGIQVEAQAGGDVKISCTIDNDLFVVVQSLPQTGIANRLYLVPKSSPAGQNIHDEYLYVNGKWEQVGTVAVDLGNYYTKGEANNKTNELIAAHNSSDDAHAGMFVSVPQQTITTAMWTPSGSRFKCSVNVAGMKATSIGWWSPAHDSEEECASAGVLSLVQTFAGRYELYAKKRPTKNIIVHVFYKK